MRVPALCLWLVVAGCQSTGGRVTTSTTGSTNGATNGATNGSTNGSTNGTTGGRQDMALPTDECTTDPQACYTVYAHSDYDLFSIDLMAKTLVVIGDFNAPKVNVSGTMKTDIMTDLAVAPDNTIYVISETQLYTADPNDAHVTLVGKVTACGSNAVAMTFAADGTLYAGDHKGAFCKIDLSTTPPTVTQIAKLSGGLALAGDIVAVGDGTMYGTATKLSDTSGGTLDDNLLIKIDPATASTTIVGSTGSKNLYGISYALGQVFGFTHDNSGNVVTIDPMTGQGTLFNTFTDPTNKNMPASFAGAGVNSMVAPVPVQ
jgi:hypothetical protein